MGGDVTVGLLAGGERRRLGHRWAGHRGGSPRHADRRGLVRPSDPGSGVGVGLAAAGPAAHDVDSVADRGAGSIRVSSTEAQLPGTDASVRGGLWEGSD